LSDTFHLLGLLDVTDVVQRSRRELTFDEITRVLKAAEGEWRILFAIGVFAGLRLSGCCTLRWALLATSPVTLQALFP
jgi:integrase